MSLVANAKAKLAAGNVAEAFKNEEGAIDLASIMVGIIVIGLIGGVIAATVFAVIPWAQDNAAKQQLDSVASAESAYVGLSTQGTNASFGDATGLNTQNLFNASNANVKVAVQGGGNTAHYVAADKSASGKIFYITDTKTQPTQQGTETTPLAASIFQNTGGATPAPGSIPVGTVINGVTWGSGTTAVSWTGTASF